MNNTNDKPTPTKRCEKCGLEKALSSFNKVPAKKMTAKMKTRTQDGHYPGCIECNRKHKVFEGNGRPPTVEKKRYAHAKDLLEDLGYDPLYEAVRMSEEIDRRIELEYSKKKPSTLALRTMRDTQHKLLSTLVKYRYPTEPKQQEVLTRTTPYFNVSLTDTMSDVDTPTSNDVGNTGNDVSIPTSNVSIPTSIPTSNGIGNTSNDVGK